MKYDIVNYYTIMNEYLEVMNFSPRERQEVRKSITDKIDYAIEKNDYKHINKRMKSYIKEIEKRYKLLGYD